MVSEKKKLDVEKLKGELKKYPVIGMLDMFKLPGKQLQDIRDKLRGKAVIKMYKKNVMKIAIENSKINGLEEIESEIKNQPALLLSEMNPFELARIIASSKSSAPARAGDIAVKDIVVKEGPTNLKPGPVIGELQRVKIPAGVEGDKIVVKKDTVVAKEGEEIGKPLADMLMKLGIEPLEISLNLIAVFDNGTIYKKGILFIPGEKYENGIINAYRNAFNLTLNIGLPTSENLPLLITKAYQEAKSLALEANILTKDAAGSLLTKAKSEAEALKKAGSLEIKESPEKKEDSKEEVKKEPKEDKKTEEKKRVKKEPPKKATKKKEGKPKKTERKKEVAKDSGEKDNADKKTKKEG